MQSWRDCLRHAIDRLDDRRSDARTVAAAAAEACRATRIAVTRPRIEAFLKHPPIDGEVEKAIDANRKGDIDFASVIVLGLRR